LADNGQPVGSVEKLGGGIDGVNVQTEPTDRIAQGEEGKVPPAGHEPPISRKKEVRAPRRGRVFRFFFPFTSFFVINCCVMVFWVYFFVLNRTRIIGRHNVGNEKNTLLLSNHQSMIDSFLVGMGAYFPQAIWKPHLMPWNPAAEENFFKTPLLAWLADNWKCIPVRRGRRDFHAVHRMSQVLPKGVIVLFPEGTRTRDGSVLPGRPGVGLVALATRPRVIPVAIEGMNRVLPVGTVLPRIFQRISVYYGPPVDCADLYAMPRNRETTQLLVERATEAIRTQYAALRANAGFETD
jgi:1-acyl-sn-glycerol-3-phosphate acyltransferase